jgi:solute carrier family 35 protein E1
MPSLLPAADKPSWATHLAHNGVTKRLQPLGLSSVKNFLPAVSKKSSHSPPNWVSLVALIMSWYLLSSASNNIAKIVLGHFPFPLTISLLHSLPATLSFLWIAGSRGHDAYPELTIRAFKHKWKWGLFLGLCSLCGGTLHRISLMFVPVSFVHTIKACQPVFAVVLARLWLHETMPRLAYVALLPIVCGVGLAACTEMGFNVIGFVSAIASSFILCLGNIAAKKLMTVSIGDLKH